METRLGLPPSPAYQFFPIARRRSQLLADPVAGRPRSFHVNYWKTQILTWVELEDPKAGNMMGLGAFTTAGSYGRVLGLGGFVMGLAQCISMQFYEYPCRPYIVHSCTNECLYQTVRTFVCTKLYEHLFVPNCMTMTV